MIAEERPQDAEQRKFTVPSPCIPARVIFILLIAAFLLTLPLLPFVFEDAFGSNSSFTNFSINVVNNTSLTASANSSIWNITCSEQFYFDQTTMICAPECGVWSPLDNSVKVFLDAITAAAGAVGNLAGVCVFILACIQRHKIFTYPTVMMIYQTVAVMITGLSNVLQLLAPSKAFCTSQNLLENLMRHESSLLCQLSGALLMFTRMTIAFLWLFQASTFFFGVMWPYKYSVARSSHKIKYLHITAVFVSLSIPLVVTVAVHFSEGFGMSLLSATTCVVINANDGFYSYAVPVNIVVAIGVSLLVPTVWKLSNIENRCKKSTTKYKIRTPEVKISLLILYYSLLLMCTVSLTSKVLSYSRSGIIQEHIVCQSQGKEASCSRDAFNEFQNVAIAHAISNVLIYLLPCGIFVFLLDCDLIRKLCCRSTRTTPRCNSYCY